MVKIHDWQYIMGMSVIHAIQFWNGTRNTLTDRGGKSKGKLVRGGGKQALARWISSKKMP